ncbi:MAG TPA: hypothetical protein VJU58_05600 [Microbacterium sp.]|nr:hypothetical protein [Microbacterium sp.]
MAAPRSHRPADDLFPNTLLATTAVHGTGLPVRLRLLALLIALVIAAAWAAFAPTATEDADAGDTRSSRGFGRHAPFLPLIEDAE